MSEETTEKKFNRETARPLIGHVSQETAFVQPDYPYGRRLRCQRRVWVETNPRYGMRLVTQTSNPKKRTLTWNKPDPSTYSTLVALWVDDKDFVATDRLLASYSNLEAIKAWGERNKGLIEADDYVSVNYNALLRAAEDYEARKAKGEVKLRVNKTEWVPGQGIVRSTEVITVP